MSRCESMLFNTTTWMGGCLVKYNTCMHTRKCTHPLLPPRHLLVGWGTSHALQHWYYKRRQSACLDNMCRPTIMHAWSLPPALMSHLPPFISAQFAQTKNHALLHIHNTMYYIGWEIEPFSKRTRCKNYNRYKYWFMQNIVNTYRLFDSCQCVEVWILPRAALGNILQANFTKYQKPFK